MILGSWDQVLHQAPRKESASPSAYVSASLSVSLMNKTFKKKKSKLGILGSLVMSAAASSLGLWAGVASLYWMFSVTSELLSPFSLHEIFQNSLDFQSCEVMNFNFYFLYSRPAGSGKTLDASFLWACPYLRMSSAGLVSIESYGGLMSFGNWPWTLGAELASW